MRHARLLLVLLIVVGLMITPQLSASAAPPVGSDAEVVGDGHSPARGSSTAGHLLRFANQWRTKANDRDWSWVRRHSTHDKRVISEVKHHFEYGRLARLNWCDYQHGWSCGGRYAAYYLELVKVPAGLRVSNLVVMD